jgi:Tetracyclin repressor-like, C-terminal domain
VAELVTIGFTELRKRMADAIDERVKQPKQDKRALMRACGMAYISFAIDRPALFSIMFRPEQYDLSKYPQSIDAGQKAYAELGRMVGLIYQDVSARQQPIHLETLGLTYWAQVHGISCLIVDGPLGMMTSGSTERRALAAQCLEGFVEAMMHSLR